MTEKQKKDNIKKKKIIIISALVFLLIVMLTMLTIVILHFHKKSITQNNDNILYYSEKQNEEGENDVLVVGIEGELNENLGEEPNPNGENPKENNSNENGNKNTKKEVDIPYYIKVNNQANVVTVYKKDKKGEYNTPIKAMICSIGDATPASGVYTMSDKYTWRLLQGNVYGQYAYRITGHILFHSVPYTAQDKSTLEWWEYDKLGTKASLGCIRLKVEDARWIYNNCIPGTQVEFYSSSNPGPLGKPTARKISSDDEVKNWDPTDPDSNNPWKEYLNRKEEEKKKAEEAKKQEQAANSKPAQKDENVNNTTSKPTVSKPVVSTEASDKVQNNISDKNQNKIENNTVQSDTKQPEVKGNKI